MKYAIGFIACFIIMAFVNMFCVSSLSKRSDELEKEYNKHLAVKNIQIEIATERNNECRITLEKVLDTFAIEPRPIYIEE